MESTKEINQNAKTIVAGGWSKFRCANQLELDVFNKVKFSDGIIYEPVAASMQVVAGANYRFFCNARAMYADAKTYCAIVNIYEPLKGLGDPYVTEIKPLEF